MQKTPQNDGVKIYEPDRSLQIKVGTTNLDQVFTKEAIENAQKVIENSSEGFLDECQKLMDDLTSAFDVLKKDPNPTKEELQQVIDNAFSIKSKTGLGGYTLASDLAKSLQLHAEQALEEGFEDKKVVSILEWHVQSLQQFLKMKVKGNGGATGEAILQEIARLAPEQK